MKGIVRICNWGKPLECVTKDKARRCLAAGRIDKVVSIGDTEVKMGNSVFIATFKLYV